MFSVNQCMIGLKCLDFAMVAADEMLIDNIIIMKKDDDRFIPINDHLLMGVHAEKGDLEQFSQYIKSSLMLYETKNGYELNNKAAVHFTRNSLVEWHKRDPTMLASLLIAGWDQESGGQLYSLDCFGSCLSLNYLAHGFSGLLSHSVFDFLYIPGMTEPEAYEVLKTCVNLIQRRYFVNFPSFLVKVVNRDGICSFPEIKNTSVGIPTDNEKNAVANALALGKLKI